MTAALATAALVINELMAANVGTVYSPATNFDSWIELYNPGTEAVSLKGMVLSDHRGYTWQMPATMGSVPAGGYMVVWMGSNDIRDDQATFKLDCDGGTITLADAGGNIVATQDYPEAMSRTAWARTTDGGSEWGWTADATPGASNAGARFASERLQAPVVDTGSRLFTGSIKVKVDIPEGARLMYTTDGSLPEAPLKEGEEVSPWKEYVRNGSCEGTDASSLISRDYNGDDVERIVEGVGYDGSRGIRVHASRSAQNDYDAQLFIYTPDHIWRSGERYRFSMKVRADKAARITAQTHTTPHNYIYGSILDGSYNVTTEWQEIYYEGTITDQQVGKQGGGWWWGGQETVEDMQTIALNLNADRIDNNFYFDDVSWQLYIADGEMSATEESKDGVFTVTKTSAYTFRLYQEGKLPSVPVTRSYIQTSNNYSLPIVSIVGDKRYFNDPKSGFDCDGDGTNGKTGNGQDWPRNYNQPWDRPVNFSYLSPEGEMPFNQDVNISASGGWTRSQRFRSFKLKANKVFDGEDHFNFAFFPQKPFIRSKNLLVRNGGNDIWTHNARFMDPALETIIQRSGIDVDVQSYVPVIEYVNGELRGVLNLREPNNDKFAYANWGYDDKELDAFENMVMKNGDDVALNRIFELARNINAEGAFDELKTLLDIDEFTNYMAVTMFLDNDDWPNNNMKAYRSRNDGRYRFVSFDLDYAFALRNFNKDNDNPFKYFLRFKDADYVYDENNFNREIVRLFLNLLDHEGYRRKFIDTFCIVAGSVFEPTRANAIVDELLAKVQPMAQLMKQQRINDGHDPDRAATTIKNKLKGRSATQTENMRGFQPVHLSNTNKQAVTLKANAEGARLYINGINVPYADFNGHLFAPVTLRAEAPAGYRFAGWKKGNTIVGTDEEMSLPTGSIVSLTATFTALTTDELAAQGINPVRINEVSAANGIHVNDLFKRNDWVELYNTTNQPIDVEGMYLSDNANKPMKWQITGGESIASTIIPAHGYLIIWCDKLEPVSQLHATFKLAAEGGDVLLTAADGSWTDRLAYPTLAADQTAGRYPDGCEDVLQMNIPTIAQANVTSSYTMPVEQTWMSGISDIAALAPTLKASYVVGSLVVNGAADSRLSIDVVNTAGQLFARINATTDAYGHANVSLAQLPAGAFVARVADAKGTTTAVKFIR